MKTTVMIELKDLYASLECHSRGLNTRKTALAIITRDGYILSSTPLFKRGYGQDITHIKQLPFNIKDKTITATNLSPTSHFNLKDWIEHTHLITVHYPNFVNNYQKLLHYLAHLKGVEQLTSLNYKTLKLTFSKTLTDQDIRHLQGLILRYSGIYTNIGTSHLSDKKALQALEWAKDNPNGRAHNNQTSAILRQTKAIFNSIFEDNHNERLA